PLRQGHGGQAPRRGDRRGPLRAGTCAADEHRAAHGPGLPRRGRGGCGPGAGRRAGTPGRRREVTGHVLARAAGAVLLGLAAGALNVGAQVPPVPPARIILQMALEAPRLVDYEGTKVITVLRGDRVETITVAESHKRPERMRLEYVSPEDLAGRLIVDNGATAWHYEPRLNMVFEGPTLGGQLLSRDRTLLLRNYGVTALGVEDVIGRQAYVIALVPHHPGVQRRLWVDRATGTILRSEELDPSRGVILSAYFSRVSFSLNLPEAYFEFRTPAGSIGWPSAGKPIAVEGRPARFVDLGYFRVLIWEQGRLRVTAVGTVPTETMVTAAGQIAAGREQALVQDVSRQIESDPATV